MALGHADAEKVSIPNSADFDVPLRGRFAGEHKVVELRDGRPAAQSSSPLLELFNNYPSTRTYQAGSTILLHGYPVDAIHLIVSGTVRCCTISPDGSRQIFRFATKGEFVGISDIDTWHYTAEAVDHVTLRSVPCPTLEQVLAVDVGLRQELRQLLSAHLQERERQLLSMVTTKAPERLLQFLHGFASTRSGSGYIALPMCRRDIADHLGLSVETVSRAFSTLKRTGRISLSGAEKYKINHAALIHVA